MFWAISDYILKKNKVPFHLLSQKTLLTFAEKQILLNNYCAEIVHALRSAERPSLPI
jgi:hypothetical protein